MKILQAKLRRTDAIKAVMWIWIRSMGDLQDPGA